MQSGASEDGTSSTEGRVGQASSLQPPTGYGCTTVIESSERRSRSYSRSRRRNSIKGSDRCDAKPSERRLGEVFAFKDNRTGEIGKTFSVACQGAAPSSWILVKGYSMDQGTTGAIHSDLQPKALGFRAKLHIAGWKAGPLSAFSFSAILSSRRSEASSALESNVDSKGDYAGMYCTKARLRDIQARTPSKALQSDQHSRFETHKLRTATLISRQQGSAEGQNGRMG